MSAWGDAWGDAWGRAWGDAWGGAWGAGDESTTRHVVIRLNSRIAQVVQLTSVFWGI